MNSFEQIRLSTPRLLLRPLALADAPALWQMFSDRDVMRYWSTPPWANAEEAPALIQRDLLAMAAGQYLRLALTGRGADSDAGAIAGAVAGANPVLGVCTLFDLNPGCRRAEIGYALARSAWGRGLMHEALQTLLGFGFDQLQLNRVEADVDPRNTASMRSLQRLGFAQEGLLRERWIVGGEVSDSALFGLLRRDWAARPVDPPAAAAAAAAAGTAPQP